MEGVYSMLMIESKFKNNVRLSTKTQEVDDDLIQMLEIQLPVSVMDIGGLFTEMKSLMEVEFGEKLEGRSFCDYSIVKTTTTVIVYRVLHRNDIYTLYYILI